LLGWWLVDREGELGWAPASHLEPTDNGSEITTSKVFPPGKGKLLNSLNNDGSFWNDDRLIKRLIKHTHDIQRSVSLWDVPCLDLPIIFLEEISK